MPEMKTIFSAAAPCGHHLPHLGQNRVVAAARTPSHVLIAGKIGGGQYGQFSCGHLISTDALVDKLPRNRVAFYAFGKFPISKVRTPLPFTPSDIYVWRQLRILRQSLRRERLALDLVQAHRSRRYLANQHPQLAHSSIRGSALVVLLEKIAQVGGKGFK
jgi:hypothetical protein